VLSGYTDWTVKPWRVSLVSDLFIVSKRNSCLSSTHSVGFSFRLSPFVLVLASATLLLLSGCDRKPGVKTSISQLEKAFGSKAPPGAAEQPAPGQAPRADAKGYVQIALAAARTNDYATAVAMLEAAIRAPGITPDQFLVVQQAKSALLTDLQNQAEKGAASAQSALKSIEQSRSH
jgi:hypothetical protein